MIRTECPECCAAGDCDLCGGRGWLPPVGGRATFHEVPELELVAAMWCWTHNDATIRRHALIPYCRTWNSYNGECAISVRFMEARV